ncbi:hypothetical protein [Nocardia iowensis]|uniref:DUF1127 domain-containing protein n=1 Tax=Nocardia iowensis TaxID=204891 RepID=A0ABX8RNB5_NOCIO|nr:hypothetical protein [Nocardia iowensis]QXN90392.1 hypothetical protein KV110_34110 [Nocardia iowensis]
MTSPIPPLIAGPVIAFIALVRRIALHRNTIDRLLNREMAARNGLSDN